MISILLFFFVYLFVYMLMGLDFFLVFYMFIVFMFMLILYGTDMMGGILYKFSGLFMLDSIGYMMVVLSFWVIVMSYFLLCLDVLIYWYMNLILFSLVLSFVSSSIYMYYIFFEFSLIPMFLLILGFGSTQDRLLSALYMFIYTMFGSMPFFFIIMYMGGLDGFLGFDLYYYGNFKLSNLVLLFFMVFFMVKIPIFMFHIWLPKAHVEAPVYGSMILASIMLKLGGYGFIRLMDMVDFGFWGDWVMGLSMLGMFILGLLCLYVSDMKVLVAYSSVIHMCMMICGFFSFSLVGYMGGFIMMISHGICSSGLFMMVNYMYERSGSRLMIFNKGFIGLIPMYSFFLLFMIMDNIGAPPSLSMVGEIYVLMGLINFYLYYFIFLICGLFFISSYFLNMYMVVFDSWSGGIFVNLYIKDYYLIFYHLYPLNMVVLVLSSIY